VTRLLVAAGWAASLVVTAALAAGVVFALTRPADQVVASWRQPDSVTYDGATYRLAVVDRGSPLTGERYTVYIGQELKGMPTYGHWVDLTFYGADAVNQRAAITSATVEWDSAGVTLRTSAGERLFTPARLFVGGR
jgi:hypothetical protein